MRKTQLDIIIQGTEHACAVISRIERAAAQAYAAMLPALETGQRAAAVLERLGFYAEVESTCTDCGAEGFRLTDGLCDGCTEEDTE